MQAYFDCFSGISGDMSLGALIDLGVAPDWLKERLGTMIPLSEFDITVTGVERNGIRASRVSVQTREGNTSRNYIDIQAMIKNSPLPEAVKSTGLQIFERLAVAEAHIHNCPVDRVHFHEVGGIDAIVDIVGTALCLDYLGISKVIASRIPLGKGFVECSHGKLPVPAPATLAILEGVPVYGTDIPFELVTPTGAAIVATLAKGFEAVPDMTITGIGYGAGIRDNEERPNLLRIITGNESKTTVDSSGVAQQDCISVLETCIDDMSPEISGYLAERLFADGALDVCWMPVYMKKNRPGTMLQVLCRNDTRDALIERIFSETTTLGIRYHDMNRCVLEREPFEVNTRYGVVAVKRVKDPAGHIRLVPEYESCRKIALKRNIPLRVVYETISADADRKFPGERPLLDGSQLRQSVIT